MGDPIFCHVSGVVSYEWIVPKALWLRRNQRDLFDRAE